MGAGSTRTHLAAATGMLFADLVDTSRAVAGTRSRLEKAAHLADLLRRLAERRASGELGIGVSYLAGELPQGKIGVGPASLRAVRGVPAADAPSLSLLEVDAALTAVGQVSGAGSKQRREDLLADLFGRVTADAQPFLAALLVGELRQGALAGLMVEGLAEATGAPAAGLRRALMVSGDLAAVARAVLEDGEAALESFRVELFRPLQPMLAQTAASAEEAVTTLGEAFLDWKMDGARVQVHKRGDRVRVYSRHLREVTRAVPEVVEAARELAADSAILDGEVLALTDGGAPRPFQVTMRRFGRRLDIAEMRRQLPLSTFFFDLLAVDGEELLDRPLQERLAALDRLVPADRRMPRLHTTDPEAAAAFFDDALRRGHEGIMAKHPASPYQAGSRGAAWLKVKPVHTLDLAVLAAEWGSGRRRGFLSNLHLGARLADPEQGPLHPDRADPRHAAGWVMLGKTFKGMSDETLAWQTARLQELAVESTRRTVYVRPELVVEVAFNDLQESPQYPGGLALRFARILGYRDDKGATEADTFAAVRALHAQQSRDPGGSED